jgi:hypothetical protein
MNRDFMLLLIISFICGVLLHSILIDYDILEGTAVSRRTGGSKKKKIIASGGNNRKGVDQGGNKNDADKGVGFAPNDLTQDGEYQCLWQATAGVNKVGILDGSTITRENWFDLWNPDKVVNNDRHLLSTTDCVNSFHDGTAAKENGWSKQVKIGSDQSAPCNDQINYFCNPTNGPNDLRSMFKQIRNGIVPDKESPPNNVQIPIYQPSSGELVKRKNEGSATPSPQPSTSSGIGGVGGSSTEGTNQGGFPIGYS